ncbi:hypothetical protein BU15DRAFT_72461 [Melanogaster broomeanus]|nr:hypothetical protein BU15DRAFT_72461 [Melanogaster broomeanus]
MRKWFSSSCLSLLRNIHILSPSTHLVSISSFSLCTSRNGVFGTTTPIVNIVFPRDSTSNDTSAVSSCPLAKSIDVSGSSHESPRARLRLPRASVRTSTHLHLSRGIKLGSSYQDTIIVAVCLSVGGAGLVATVVLVKYRRRSRGLIGDQDALPRPFDIIVPAPTVTSTSVVSHGPAGPRLWMPMSTLPRSKVSRSCPVLDISPRNRPESETGRGYGSRAKVVSPGKKSSRSRTVPAPVSASQSQPGASTSRDTGTQRHNPSDLQMHANHDQRPSPSSSRSPDHSQARTPVQTQSNPQSQPHPQSRSHSDSHAQPSSSSSIPIHAQPHQPAVASSSRSASIQERRSAKRALFISRSASDMYRAASSAPRSRTHHYGTSRYAYRNYARDLDADAVTRPTDRPRRYYSASPIIHLERDSEHEAGGAIIIEHRDAGVMDELPPPYHKLLRSDEGVYR